MVLRRSTTRWTWPSDFNNSERSTVTFIAKSVAEANKCVAADIGGYAKVAWRGGFGKAGAPSVRPFPCFSQLSGPARQARAINPGAGV